MSSEFNNKTLMKGFFDGDAWVKVNKRFARKVGFMEAGVFGEFIATDDYAEKNNLYFEGGELGPWFYLTQGVIEERFGIKRRSYETIVKNLEKSKVITKRKMGIPCKNYYMINWDVLTKIMSEKEPETASQSVRTECTNRSGDSVHTGTDTAYIQDSTEHPNILYKKKYIKEQDKSNINKNIDDDEKKPVKNSPKNKSEKKSLKKTEKFKGVNIYAFNEFRQEFDEDFPNLFSDELYSRIFEQMEIQELELFNIQEAVRQARYMNQKMEKGEIIADYAAYFVNGIKLKQTSKQNSLNERKLYKAKSELQKQKTEQAQREQKNEVPVYDWLNSKEE